jgi:hypothetical protein
MSCINAVGPSNQRHANSRVREVAHFLAKCEQLVNNAIYNPAITSFLVTSSGVISLSG